MMRYVQALPRLSVCFKVDKVVSNIRPTLLLCWYWYASKLFKLLIASHGINKITENAATHDTRPFIHSIIPTIS